MKNCTAIYRPWTLLLLCIAVLVPSFFAQIPTLPAPRQEKLLNGLTVLMWNDARAGNVSLKVRVHAGSAFDPKGKEGVMKLLAAHIFPTDEAREFFADELGGSLQVISNYDYIQINAASKPDKFLELVETVANAVNNLNIDKESVGKLKPKQAEEVKRLEKDPVYVADLAASQRLLGTFPYARPENGTLESLGRIDFADLLFAKERFFTADNATVAISGNFDASVAFRALRRYFGNWLKADKKTPTAFRQPDPPDTKSLAVKFNSPGAEQFRYAIRGVARNDKDYPGAEILAAALNDRVLSRNNEPGTFVHHQSHVLPGVMVIGSSATIGGSGVVSQMLSTPVTQEEFSRAWTNLVSTLSTRSPADWWLDSQTYKIASVSDDIRSINGVSLTDVRRVQDRLAKNPMAAISLIPAAATRSN